MRPAGIVSKLLLAGAYALLLSGCVTATVQQVRQAETAMTEDDAIVVMGRRNRPSQGEAELDFIDCVSRNMGSGSNSVQVILGLVWSVQLQTGWPPT